MSKLAEFWAAITPAQATIISGGLTLLAATFGVVLGWRLFSGRVNDLKGALDASDKLVAAHSTNVQNALASIIEKVTALDSQFTTVQESLATLRGSVGELQDVSAQEAEAVNTGPAVNRESLRDNWDAIRNVLEQRAADPTVDGRTRARYARIDRRRYLDLINALASDNALGPHASSYREAAGIWQRYRAGRATVTTEDAAKMSSLRQLLAGRTDAS